MSSEWAFFLPVLLPNYDFSSCNRAQEISTGHEDSVILKLLVLVKSEPG